MPAAERRFGHMRNLSWTPRDVRQLGHHDARIELFAADVIRARAWYRTPTVRTYRDAGGSNAGRAYSAKDSTARVDRPV